MIKNFWVQRYWVSPYSPNIWDILHGLVTNGVINGRNVTNSVNN